MSITKEYDYHNVNNGWSERYNHKFDQYMQEVQELSDKDPQTFDRTLTYEKDIVGSEWNVVDVGNIRQTMSLSAMQKCVSTAPVQEMINLDQDAVYGAWDTDKTLRETTMTQRLAHPELRGSGLTPSDYFFKRRGSKDASQVWDTGASSCRHTVWSFDYTVDKLPVTKTLYDMLIKLKKSHPHIQATVAYKRKRLKQLFGIDAFTEWAMEKSKTDPLTKNATLTNWLEKEVQHTECGSRGFVTGMRLTAVMLHDTKTNTNYGILQHLPNYRAGQSWAKVVYYAPRILREKAEYDHREFRVHSGECYVSSANPSRLLTQIKRTFTPLSLMEKFWLTSKRIDLIRKGTRHLAQEKEKQSTLIRNFYHKISVEEAFKQFVNMYVNNTALQPTDLPPQAVNAIEEYLEAKRENDENVDLQDGLAPVTLFTVPDSDRVYFTPWDGEGFGDSSMSYSHLNAAPDFMYVESADRLPSDIHGQLAVMDMTRKARSEKKNDWDTSVQIIPCVGAYTNWVTKYIDPEKGLWIKLFLMVYVPESVVRDLLTNADGTVHVE